MKTLISISDREELYDIGRRLAAARHERGETEKSVAAAVGISRAALSRIENGSYDSLKYTVVRKLCSYLGVELP